MKVLVPVTSKPPVNLSELELWKMSPLEVGNKLSIDFVKALSLAIMQDKDCRPFSELVALGFWLREKNVLSLLSRISQEGLKALGHVVHFTPANVDTMFVYSWVCSLLMGNNNLVRVSSRGTEEQAKLISILNKLLSRPEYASLSARNCFIQLNHSDPAESEQLAVACLQADARVIWGGDESINAIRSYPCAPRCRDICFSDRYSASIIDATQVAKQDQADHVFSLLQKDMSPYQQQACSSPRILYWLGDSESLRQFLARVQFQKKDENGLSTRNEQLFTEQASRIMTEVNQVLYCANLCVIECQNIDDNIMNVHSGNQVLFCQCINSIDDLTNRVSPRLQTLSYFGVDKSALVKFINNSSIKGIDRIVPMGDALAFSPEWDGYDLLSQLSRRVVVL